jgi:hypothetical protein
MKICEAERSLPIVDNEGGNFLCSRKKRLAKCGFTNGCRWLEGKDYDPAERHAIGMGNLQLTLHSGGRLGVERCLWRCAECDGDGKKAAR